MGMSHRDETNCASDRDSCSCSCGCGCEHGHDEVRRPTVRMILWYSLGAIPVILGFLHFLPTPVTLTASLIAYLLFGFSVWREMIRGFARRRIFTEFTLMCVASLGAFCIGEYADAAAVVYLYSLGEGLSEAAYSRSRKNITELLAATPEEVTVLRDGRTLRLDPREVEEGEFVLLVAGERNALDGTVLEGGGDADTSSVTGESTPLELYEGIDCPSGAILTHGSVILTVQRRYEKSIMAQLARAVEEAEERKAQAEKKITRFARIFTPLAFAGAITVSLVGWLISGELRPWLHAGLVLLVVSCPCSMVLSVPLTYFAGLGNAASRGIVFRGSEVMDSLGKTATVVFDKTGTLSESTVILSRVELCGELSEEEFRDLAYTVLCHSPHVAAQSFCHGESQRTAGMATDVEILGGRGIVCSVDGCQACFGNAALMRENGIDLPDSPTTAIFGAWKGRLQGVLRFTAPLKKQTVSTVTELRQLGVRRIAVISGDGAASVEEACREAGIEEYYAHLTPSEKVERFKRITEEERTCASDATVAYCGDGLNDSAVIAGADVGIAMGRSGSALTVSSADVVIMDDDPSKLCQAIRIARRTSRIATQNIVLSLGIKLAVLVIGILISAICGSGIPMGLAIVADVGAALLAVFNALRAADRKKKKGACHAK